MNTIVTLAIPHDLKKKMEDFPETNWSEVMRQFLQNKIHRMGILKEMNKLLEHSEITDQDIDKIGHIIKEKGWKKIKKLV